MTARGLLLLSGALLAGGCGERAGSDAATMAREAAGAGPPASLLLITVDTLRPDYLGVYGYDRPSSPYLDELLADAFHFERAAAPVPRTTPALASLLTGAYPHTTGVRRLLDHLGKGVTTLAEALGRRGYQTVAVVTNRVLEKERGLDRGFEIYDQAPDTRGAQETTAAALRRLGELDVSRPFFVWVHYIDPHMPYEPGAELARAFDPGYAGRYAENFGTWEGKDHNRGALRNRSPYPKDLPTPEAVHRNPLPEEVNAHIRRLYAADVRATDDALRAVVDAARERCGGRMAFVFTADHGESLGEHDYYWFHGDYVYNAASRVPLAILAPPGHPAARSGRSSEWASLVDVAPTALELLGMDPAGALGAQVDGRSLLPAMLGEPLPPRPVFCESGRAHHSDFVHGRASNDLAGRFRAVFLGDWKLIHAPGREDAGDAWQLYDLAADPHETHDLYRPDHPRFLELQPLLLRWMALGGGGASEHSGLGGEEAAILSEMGYAADED